MTITLKNGELRYAVNDSDLGSVIKIDISKKKEMYLMIHTRNPKSKAEIVYISEIFNWVKNKVEDLKEVIKNC